MSFIPVPMVFPTGSTGAPNGSPPIMVEARLQIQVADVRLLWHAASIRLTRSGLSSDEVEECIGTSDDELPLDCLRTLLSVVGLPGCDLIDLGVVATPVLPAPLSR